MMLKAIFPVLIVMLLSGCVTSQKHAKNDRDVAGYDKKTDTYYEGSSSAPAAKYLVPSAKPQGKKHAKPINLTARQIQQALKSSGYYQGTIDGVIGPQTKNAIIKFQKAHGLKADGIVGKNTSSKLNKYL